jgi:hypothetical protein
MWIDSLILPPFRKAPTPVKYIVLAGETYAIYQGYKLAKKHIFKSDLQKQTEQNVQLVKTEAEQILKNNAILPPEERTIATFSPSQYKTFAQNLFTAMDGAGTTWKDIHAVFSKMQNDLDILYLIDAFGTRAGTSIFASSTPTDLSDWLSSDGVTNDVNAILETKAKISKRF